MSTRALYLDRSPGEVRGLVTLGGKPERLLIERDGESVVQRLGAVSVGRVRRLERALGLAFIELAGGEDATAPIGWLVEGSAVEVEVAAEGRRGKAPVVRVLGSAEGQPRLLAAGPGLVARLAAYAPGAAIVEGTPSRTLADEAEEVALQRVHDLAGGGALTIEPTQALTAIDVDMGARSGGDPRRAAKQANLAAIAEGARLLRLKGLGGLVVFDLIGKGHDGAAISAAAKAAFQPDGAAVSIGPISRFGLFELSLPRTVTPTAERLTGASGRLTALSCALRVARVLEREGRADPGGRLLVRCSADVAAALEPYIEAMTDLLGSRFEVRVESGLDREAYAVSTA